MSPYVRVCATLAILLGASGNSCTTSDALPSNCGVFNFTPQDPDWDAPPGAEGKFSLSFTHNPQGCPVSCRGYWFVQAIREMDLDSNEFVQPNDTQQARMVTGNSDFDLNGWAIDREEGQNFGYYGVDNQFKLIPPAEGDPPYQLGAGPLTSAIMHDRVIRGDKLKGRNIQVTGLTAAVGIDQGSPCFGKILGLKKWMIVFAHDADHNVDTVSKPIGLDAVSKDTTAFNNAAVEWDKHLDDGRQRLPSNDPSTGFSMP